MVITMLFSYESAAKTVYVDLSIDTTSGDTYPTLQQAIQALYDSKNQLKEYNNSITLLPSCASRTLTFSNGTLRGRSAGGIVNITFPSMSNQNINKLQTCSQLPIIDLSTTGSYFNLSSLTYLSISGITIQYSATSSQNLFSNIETVSFSSFCFNNTEPTLGSTGSLPAGMKTNFVLTQVSNVSMSNGIYTYDAFKTLLITGSDTVNLTSMTYLILSTTRDLNNQALRITSPTFAPTVVNATGMSASCQSKSLVMPTLIYTSNITSVDISNYNCLAAISVSQTVINNL